MVKEINKICDKMNKTLGISIPLPVPGKKALEIASVCNLAVGIGMLSAGIALTSRWCTVLGGMGIVSSIALRKESTHAEDIS